MAVTVHTANRTNRGERVKRIKEKREEGEKGRKKEWGLRLGSSGGGYLCSQSVGCRDDRRASCNAAYGLCAGCH